MRVLIVEDERLLGDALQVGLREQGFAAEWLHDGRSADEALRTEEFAAVVLDIGLPRMDGLELLRPPVWGADEASLDSGRVRSANPGRRRSPLPPDRSTSDSAAC